MCQISELEKAAWCKNKFCFPVVSERYFCQQKCDNLMHATVMPKEQLNHKHSWCSYFSKLKSLYCHIHSPIHQCPSALICVVAINRKNLYNECGWSSGMWEKAAHLFPAALVPPLLPFYFSGFQDGKNIEEIKLGKWYSHLLTVFVFIYLSIYLINYFYSALYSWISGCSVTQ